MAKRSLLRESDFRSSERTLVSSSLASNTSSRSNVHASVSSAYDSRTDVRSNDRNRVVTDDEDDEDADDEMEKGEELESDRGLWERKPHYIMLGFGVVFGVRNIMEFPALALEHGGGAFLFTYALMIFAVGLPLIYLEVSLGQYARAGVIKAWRILPLARGIGVCSLILSLAQSSYSTTPSAWALYFLYTVVVGSHPLQASNSSALSSMHGNLDNRSHITSSSPATFSHRHSLNVSSHFFYSTTLEVSNSMSSMGHLVRHVLVCLLVIWVTVFLLSLLGPRLLGKISFVFTVIPSVLLVIILVAVCTMSGSVLGIRTFLNPRWYRLSDFQPWLDALDLVLSGLACGTGVVITLSGHCSFHGNTFRNAMFITCVSVAMTILSGCLMMSFLGVQSRLSGVDVENISHITDFGFGFVVFPTVTSNLPTPAFWCGTFYISIILLSVVKAVVVIHHLQQGVLDLVRLNDVKQRWKWATLLALVCILTALNILTTSQNGLYVLKFLHLSVSRLTTPLLCVTQCLVVGWGYGARRFAGRVTEMTGRNKSFIWKLLWRWGCPALLSLMVVVGLWTTNPLRDLPPEDEHRKWLRGVGWSLTPAILLPGMAMTLASFFKVHGSFKQRIKQLRSTPSSWGPGHPEHEPQADLPEYVICHPDPFRPANALAMLTANLYLPNIVNFGNMQPPGEDTEMAPGYLSDAATLSSSDNESTMDVPPRKDGVFGRYQATVTCLSHVIGLGNVVRFPYLAYKHEGGAFVLAYLIIMVACGLPLLVIETSLGQFSSLGPISVWKAVPLFKGIGFSMVAISVMTSIYYSVVTSWSVYYLATALTSVMPWQNCSHNWNTNSCRIVDTSLGFCQPLNLTSQENLTSSSCHVHSANDCGRPNNSSPVATSACHAAKDQSSHFTNSSTTSTGEYFYLSVVKLSDGWLDVGELRWQLALCLLMVWVMVVLFLIKGCRPGAKATYLVLSLTSIVLLILLIRSSSLVGGHDGLRYLFTPKWSKLTSGYVWRDAASQVFFSLALGSGTIITMGTYNKFTNNVFREAALLGLIDSCLSILSSLVIFAVIGALARATGMAIGSTAQADLGLAFVVLSHASLQLPWPIFWAILTFFMVVTCGVFTCAAAMATVVTATMDVFSPNLKKQRVCLLLSVSTAVAVLSLPLMVQAGFYAVDILDTHLSGLPQLFVGGAIIVAMTWIYGIGRFCGDVSRMTNSAIGWCWRLMWVVVCPFIFTSLLVMSIIYLLWGDDLGDQHPWWATLIGLLLWLMLISPVFIGAVHEMIRPRSGSFLKRLRKACQARKEWGATQHRCTSNVEYYPAVHTHLGIDMNMDGLNTITDHVEFSTVGVRVPSLSQTTLLPVSPSMPRTKRPMDMRHKAILNHAYSNPQCNASSGSLEKLGRKSKRISTSISNCGTGETIIVKKAKRRAVSTADVYTQTDKGVVEVTLCRQRSQPVVHVTKPVLMVTRSSSWHQLNGQPAVLKVDTKQYSKSRIKDKPQKKSGKNRRQRRYGQSQAPNVLELIRGDGESAAEVHELIRGGREVEEVQLLGARSEIDCSMSRKLGTRLHSRDSSSSTSCAHGTLGDNADGVENAISRPNFSAGDSNQSLSRIVLGDDAAKRVSILAHTDLTTHKVIQSVNDVYGGDDNADDHSNDDDDKSFVTARSLIFNSHNNNENSNTCESTKGGAGCSAPIVPHGNIDEHGFRDAFYLGRMGRKQKTHSHARGLSDPPRPPWNLGQASAGMSRSKSEAFRRAAGDSATSLLCSTPESFHATTNAARDESEKEGEQENPAGVREEYNNRCLNTVHSEGEISKL